MPKNLNIHQQNLDTPAEQQYKFINQQNSGTPIWVMLVYKMYQYGQIIHHNDVCFPTGKELKGKGLRKLPINNSSSI